MISLDMFSELEFNLFLNDLRLFDGSTSSSSFLKKSSKTLFLLIPPDILGVSGFEPAALSEGVLSIFTPLINDLRICGEYSGCFKKFDY